MTTRRRVSVGLRTLQVIWVLVWVLNVYCAPLAAAAPVSPLCDGGSYRKAHPLICDTGNAAPGVFPGTGSRPGGGGSGGLLGVLHSLTGGLL